MAQNKEFDSKKELDNLFKILTSSTPTLPSEILKFNNKVEYLLMDIHQLGYNAGYEKGVEINKNIKDKLSK